MEPTATIVFSELAPRRLPGTHGGPSAPGAAESLAWRECPIGDDSNSHFSIRRRAWSAAAAGGASTISVPAVPSQRHSVCPEW